MNRFPDGLDVQDVSLWHITGGEAQLVMNNLTLAFASENGIIGVGPFLLWTLQVGQTAIRTH